MNPIRLLIAEDQEPYRKSLRTILSNVTDIEIILEVEDGLQAVEKAYELLPDVILMDIAMPHMDGITATQRIHQAYPAMGIIIITMLKPSETLLAALQAGARGYIEKGMGKAEILKTIRAVAEGEAVFGPAVARLIADVLGAFNNSAPQAPSLQEALSPDPLTERELEILDFIAQGLDNQEIADRLGIARKTISNHVTKIFDKLGVEHRAQAVVRAREAGLGRGD
jgi:DNA-binding NarL/FixJ family response regulator